MNETQIAIMSGLAKIREEGVRVVTVEVTKLEELYSENARLREALEDAAIMIRLFETGDLQEDRIVADLRRVGR